MCEVGDEADGETGPGQRNTCGAGIAGGQPPMSIPAVRQMPRSDGDGVAGLRRSGIGVAETHDDIATREVPDDLECPGEFGSEGHEPHGSGAEQAVRHPEVRVDQELGLVCALPFLRHERTLEVRRQEHRPAGRIPVHLGESAQALLVVVDRLRVVGRLQRGHPAGGECVRCRRVTVGAGGAELDAGEPVDLQIHQSGDRQSAACAVRQPHIGDQPRAGIDRDVTGDDPTGDERRLHTQPQTHRTAGRSRGSTGTDAPSSSADR